MNGATDPWFNLEGRVAVVAGGGGAIGRAICARLLENEATVYCLDLAGRDAQDQVVSLDCDLTDGHAVAGAISHIEDVSGRLDMLVHAAGVTRDGRLWKTSADDWETVLATNLTSAFHLLHAATPVMRKTGPGTVVLVSSINGQRGKVGQASYSASKAGLNALAFTAARELGHFGIRVNVVAPGWIHTPMTANVPEEVRQRAVDESALGSLGEPDDVARAVLFLANDFSRHITGQVLRVDGGQLIGS
jgi:3-oxoacyl-[acyl-carrier protein] reductase